MTYRFVPAYHDYGPRKGPVRAFLVHMAEGGGTVGFLSRDNGRGVSVHYVIERSGRIVQMLRETHASGSVNPNDIRTTNDLDGFYGVTDAKAVLKAWWGDPNSAVISLELEGFAAQGPNPDQAKSLVRLVNDVRSRYPTIGTLGHRDFADYKACPGKHIDWASIGGHGVYHAPDPAPTYVVRIEAKATVRVYTMSSRSGVDCIKSWWDQQWGRRASSAVASAPVHRDTCDGTSSATTTKVLSGTFKGRHIRVGDGVTLEAT